MKFPNIFKIKPNIEKLLTEAREDERKRANVEWQKRFDKTVEQLKEQEKIIIQEKNAEVASYIRDIEERDNRLKHIEEIYTFCWKQIKANMSLAAELKLQVGKALQNQASAAQAIQQIVDKAEEYEVSMKKKEKEHKDLLGIVN